MKKKTQVLVVVMIIGIVLAVVGFGDAMTYISGKVVNVNDASIEDFDGKALAKGEVYYIGGPFATLERSQKTYGVTTSKTETNYYIVANFTKEDVENGKAFDSDTFYYVLAVANKDMISKLDAAAKEWEEYDGSSELPDIDIEIKGKLAKQSDESEYIEYRDDFLADDDTPVAEMMVVDGEIKIATLVILGVGVVLALGSLIILIVSAVKKKKEKAEELY